MFAKTKQGKRKDGCFHGYCTTFEMKQHYKKFVVALLKVTKGFDINLMKIEKIFNYKWSVIRLMSVWKK